MNTTIWILQGLMAFIFMFSGINKSYFDEQALVKKGQTGAEGLNKWLIKFIGISEVLGAIGLILPMQLNYQVYLTSLSAFCLGLIMIPAGIIHYQRKELKNVWINIAVFVICILIAYYRF